jgi:hypothetical protein
VCTFHLYFQIIIKMRVLLNSCYGGFGFSNQFIEILKSHGITSKYDDEELRDNQRVIELAEEFGLVKASGQFAELKIKEIPPFYEWKIEEYDGNESLIIEFPWRALALSYVNNNPDDPIRKAVENGTLKLPDY